MLTLRSVTSLYSQPHNSTVTETYRPERSQGLSLESSLQCHVSVCSTVLAYTYTPDASLHTHTATTPTHTPPPTHTPRTTYLHLLVACRSDSHRLSTLSW